MRIQGVDDSRAPVGERMQIYKQLEQHKILDSLILFPDGASRRGDIVLALGHKIAFVEKHLLGSRCSCNSRELDEEMFCARTPRRAITRGSALEPERMASVKLRIATLQLFGVSQ